MSHMSTTSFSALITAFILIPLLCACQTSESTSNTVKINPRLTETQIRAGVLAHTPIGSSVQDVLGFLNTKLVHVHGEPDTYDKWNRSIQILLGKYGLGRETYVAWKFDENRKLIDVFVRKYRDFL